MGFFGLFGGPQKDERTEIWETTIQAALDAFAHGEFVTALSCATGAEKIASAFPEADPRRVQTAALLEKIRRAQPAAPAAPPAASAPKAETLRPEPSPMVATPLESVGFTPSAETREKVDEWLATGARHLEQGDLARSRDAHLLAHGIARDHDDGEGVLLAAIRVTLVDQLRGLRRRAFDALADRLELAAIAPDPRFAVHVLQNLAFLEIELGRFGEARARFDRAFELADGLGSGNGEDPSVSVRGVIVNVVRRSELERSRRALEEEIRTLPADGDVDGQIGELDILAHLHADAGNDDAASLAEARLAEIKASGDGAGTSRPGLADQTTGIPARRGALGEIYRRTGGPALGRLFGLGLAPANSDAA